jgi:two-component system nitrate/nitrite response regulator NarL
MWSNPHQVLDKWWGMLMDNSGLKVSALSVLIVSRHTLVREGLKAMIADTPFRIVCERDSVRSAVEQPAGNVALVLLGVSLGSDLIERLKLLRAAYPHARTVCYSPSVNLPLKTLNAIFGSSVDGWLLSSSPPQVLRQSLELIMMGESVLPFSLIASSFPNEAEPRHEEQPQAAAVDYGFSMRELQVLEILQNGKSNKVIARQLDLSEATVKVHVKNVMRKLGVANRTEAAIWMTKHRRMVEDINGREPVLGPMASGSDIGVVASEDF